MGEINRVNLLIFTLTLSRISLHDGRALAFPEREADFLDVDFWGVGLECGTERGDDFHCSCVFDDCVFL